eukprot:883331-Amphidinium_carterae.1
MLLQQHQGKVSAPYQSAHQATREGTRNRTDMERTMKKDQELIYETAKAPVNWRFSNTILPLSGTTKP